MTPNNVQEECIRVSKVYDWVFDAISTDTGITLPDDCAAAVAAAVAEGRTPLDVTCDVPDVGGFFPLTPPDTGGNALCTVSSRIERREITLNGRVVEVAIVKVIFTIRPLITIIDSTGAIICQFRSTISESRRLVVCAPEPFTADNVFCRLISLDCDTNFIETGDPDLGLQVMLDICFEIQVEADVKLEVLAKFCFPRPNDIELPTNGVCPEFEWPAQCDFFPRDNCDCQAFVDTDALVTTVGLGITFPTGIFVDTLAPGEFTTELNAEICDNCQLTGSSLEWIVEDEVIPTGTVDQSFTFTAEEFNMPTCTTVLGITTMTVTGAGTVRFADPAVADRTVLFELTLVENIGNTDDAYAITLSDLTGTPIIVFAGAGAFVPDEDLIVQDCVTFPNLLDG
ncbi:3-deoxy-manno-octulosonate cytidylyltransferase [Cytobacillus firmus]|uniref:3-deoxy-manno-octulosonate cytidylyltransferase n=1 Tax=Cytobacillus firmus TaxID=1399 RepID=A0A800N925_CYTFI|nr:3-deoxy-manno-octulosonate cytidylyltransferase [Cytobacillus firmus]